jgi:murein DD-endopeptidase MepM/ murein hydrolase activator NlpD
VAPTTTAPIEEPPVQRVGYYADQPEFTRRTEPVGGSLNAARRRRNEAAVAVEAARQDVARLEADLAVVEQQLGALAAAEKAKADDLLTATRDFETRVVDAYVRGRPVPLAVLQGSEAIADVVSKIVMLEQVLEKDHEVVAQYEGLREEVGEVVAAAVARLDDLEGELEIARDWLLFSELTLAEAEFEIDVWAANSDTYVAGFVFPVASGYSFIDSWGFPRGPGTPWEHWHEGADIFAPTGTDLLAVESGIISRLAGGGRGGLALYIEGVSGSKHYYAHLTSYADGIVEGGPVTAGEVVGYVGDTGNAAGGLPHLHYEIHPGDRPVNPYALLATSSRRETARLTSLVEAGSVLASTAATSGAGSGD